MKLLLHRDFDSGEDTLGRLYYRDHYQDLKYVYTLEDEYREKKVKHETRIPEGFYDVIARKGGKFYDAYSKSSIEAIRAFTQKYGVLEIMNVPGFDAVLFHSGNSDKDSSGCVLLGDFINNNSSLSGYISDSINAYSRFISAVGFYLDKGETIRLEIKNFDKEIERLL
jgi:hypothetical protein